MTKLRVAFIGAGRISDLHALAYRDNPRAELYAISDVDVSTLERRTREWGLTKTYRDYHDLLADPAVDAVEIITPHHLHAPMTIDALSAGKHVSVQKPMCLNVTEADRMIASARRAGTMFRVFENFRFYPPIVKAKELLDSDAIGEPLSMRMKATQGSPKQGWTIPDSTLAWRFDDAKSGGGRVIFDYGYHLWSIAVWFLGDIEKVFSWITYRPVENGRLLDSPAVVIWKHRGAEKYGSYEAVTSDDMLVRTKYWPEDEWIEVTGSRGFIWVNRCTSMLLDRPPVVMYRDGVTTEFTDLDSDWAASFRLGGRDFADAIVEGRQSPLTGEEGKLILRITRAIQMSAQLGREVRPEEIMA